MVYTYSIVPLSILFYNKMRQIGIMPLTYAAPLVGRGADSDPYCKTGLISESILTYRFKIPKTSNFFHWPNNQKILNMMNQ